MAPAKTINIKIDRKLYRVPESENPTNGKYLRELSGVTDEYDLWQRAKGNEDDVLIDLETSVDLHDGDHFYTAKKVITPGS